MIKFSERPIAAPSANLFSHVSPTSAVHVFNDFFDKDISIIEGEKSEFGIESTVIKLVRIADQSKIVILRAGSLSEKALKDALSKSDKFKEVKIERIQREAHVSEEVNSEAPGMLLKHYSPDVETYLVELVKELPQEKITNLDVNAKESVLIDFGKALESVSRDFLDYFSLTDSGDMREAMSNLYSVLRLAENVSGAQRIYILNLQKYHENLTEELPEYLETVYDKSFRSASGKKVKLHVESKTFFVEE